ncbi:2Fe-2S iron-sulfur cluster binding domain-containing protein [Sneathiella sp. P13V-1]|uniref:(2Fe-2S)-binding protein n=1 Tax=Sneathiella sp. P13V-1 TaxID=2697366 RepID=UPI00187BA085|nr:(2Fe-2S)-binding protein [Sneathiella sp. P13V-1]MBE7637733.1 2Fe-2S iron-sulfur cluster binding domain-containing protein [Sneathiella sp. P13V-1]
MKKHTVKITVNGKEHQSEIDARTLLTHFLRDHLNITSTNIGCDTSQCGACTVLVNGESVKSCTQLAVQMDGAEITTAANDQISDIEVIKRNFHESHGLQCGYCTPGMVMSSHELLKQNSNPSDDEIRDALHGNICRCTGYHNIIEAVKKSAAEIREGAAS